jgi:hypothetical protein
MRRFLVIDQLEKKIACGGHVFNESGQNLAFFIEDLP